MAACTWPSNSNSSQTLKKAKYLKVTQLLSRLSVLTTFHGGIVTKLPTQAWNKASYSSYSTSHSCKNWTEAEKTCQAYSGNLITVRNQEENVYIQHRLNGAKGWIGLNDRVIEGTFDWADNQTSNFSYWAKNQPNNFNNEDCVHTLGVRHSFMWNDVSCGTCHNYTCSEGLWVTYLFYIPTGVTIIIIIIIMQQLKLLYAIAIYS